MIRRIYIEDRTGLAAMPEALEDATEQAMRRVVLALEAETVVYLDRHGINDTGDLRKSISHEVRRSEQAILGIVQATVRHAIFVHNGTRPHWPPVEPISQWVRSKLGITGPENKSVTFLVRRKIARVGTKAKPFFTDVLRDQEDRIVQTFSEMVGKRIALRSEVKA